MTQNAARNFRVPHRNHIILFSPRQTTDLSLHLRHILLLIPSIIPLTSPHPAHTTTILSLQPRNDHRSREAGPQEPEEGG